MHRVSQFRARVPWPVGTTDSKPELLDASHMQTGRELVALGGTGGGTLRGWGHIALTKLFPAGDWLHDPNGKECRERRR